MSSKFRRGRAGSTKYFEKHKGPQLKDFQRRRKYKGDEHRPSRYDPDARY